MRCVWCGPRVAGWHALSMISFSWHAPTPGGAAPPSRAVPGRAGAREGRAVRSLAAARDEELLRRLLRNLVDNAIKHGPADSLVWLSLEQKAGGYTIAVRDEGNGIAAAERHRIFERLFRADRARSRPDSDEAGGAGLGLAIARWIAEAHGGSLVLVTNDATGSGTEFRVWLPWAEGGALEASARVTAELRSTAHLLDGQLLLPERRTMASDDENDECGHNGRGYDAERRAIAQPADEHARDERARGMADVP